MYEWTTYNVKSFDLFCWTSICVLCLVVHFYFILNHGNQNTSRKMKRKYGRLIFAEKLDFFKKRLSNMKKAANESWIKFIFTFCAIRPSFYLNFLFPNDEKTYKKLFWFFIKCIKISSQTCMKHEFHNFIIFSACWWWKQSRREFFYVLLQLRNAKILTLRGVYNFLF